MHDPVTHSTVEVAAAVDTMTHYRLHVGDRDARNDVVLRIAGRKGKTIMFMRTKHGVDRQVKKLRRIGINAVGIHGDKGQNTRTNAIAGFSDGSVPVLVATDIAARGIDIGDVDLVVHVDPPAEHKAYLHRAGRTARAGSSGTVVTLVMEEQIQEVDTLLQKAGVDAESLEVSAHSPELVRITGAQKITGAPLPPFGAAQPQQRQKGSQSTRNTAARHRHPQQRTASKSRGGTTGFRGKNKKDGQRGGRS